jgi:hypothetical protein
LLATQALGERRAQDASIVVTLPFNGTESMSEPNLSLAVRTLFANGFQLRKVLSEPGYALVIAHRLDEFDVAQRYCFAIFEDEFSPTQVEIVQIAAKHYAAEPVLVGPGMADVPTLEWERFMSLFGGPVFSRKPFEPQFREHLRELGRNRLPEGVEGKADDLFELYVKEGLGFILGQRVVRLGQDRRFQSRPDGLALPSQGFYALYDAKAARDGYEVDQNGVRQFGSYVTEFHNRYSTYRQRLNSFLVVSGKFKQRDQALDRRSKDFLAEYRVPLCFLTADALGEMIEILSQKPVVRQAINWSRVFSDSVARPSLVRKEVLTVLGDEMVTRS